MHHAAASFKEIDHTADVGIEVRAPSLKALFEAAAEGMFSIIASQVNVEVNESRKVSVAAEDREALLVNWLSELNYLHQIERIIFCGFEIESITDHALSATLLGEQFDPGRHTIFCEIKAVTFHGMKIRRERNEWSVQIIFDM